MTYALREDLDMIFGRLNIDSWADLESTGDQDGIDDRVQYSLETANGYIDSRLVGGHYAIPITADDNLEYPRPIVLCASWFAGVFLYDARMIAGKSDNDQVSMQRILLDRYIRMILNGQIKLVHKDDSTPLDLNASKAPSIYEES